MPIVHGVRRPYQLDTCWSNITTTFTMLCSNHPAAHPPSVFQTIMGKELQLRQQNFSSFSIDHVLLRESMRHEDAREILGAIYTVAGG